MERFLQAFSSVVAEERYVQDARTSGDERHVELLSDFLFVKTGADTPYVTFRDVYSVNGHAVRDREERLTRLFVVPRPDAFERAQQISRDGYRYNIGVPDRTVANPLLTIGLLQAVYRERFDFAVAGLDTARGPDTWTLTFKERTRPTILRTREGRDVAAAGRLWIDGASGRVLQTDLELSTGDRVLTTFAYDEQLELDVPIEMRDVTWFNRAPITGTATYSHFRRFDVTTNLSFSVPAY